MRKPLNIRTKWSADNPYSFAATTLILPKEGRDLSQWERDARQKLAEHIDTLRAEFEAGIAAHKKWAGG